MPELLTPTAPATKPPDPPATESPASQWSPGMQNLLDQPPAALPWRLMAGGLLFCLAFGAWAWWGQVEEVGKARGQLVPQGQVYKLNAAEVGKAIRVAVQEGQLVQAGQVLVEFDTQLAATEVERWQQMLAAQKTELNQQQALLAKARLEAANRQAIASADLQAQQAAIAQASQKGATAAQLQAQLQTNALADEQRQSRLQPLTDKTNQLLAQLQADVAAARERVERMRPLVVAGAIAKEQMFQAEQLLREKQRAIIQTQLQEANNAREQIFQAQQALRDRQRAIAQTKGDIAAAAAEAKRLQAGWAQKQAESKKSQLEAQQQVQQLEVSLTQLQAKIAETENLLRAAKEKLQQRFLLAPVDGTVFALHLRHPGEVAQPGQTVAEIAPQNAPLVLLAQLPNDDAGLARLGMPVKIKFDAYPYQDFGIVEGKVLSISPDTKADPKLSAAYQVEIALNRDYVTSNRQAVKFKAGQTATAEIIIRRRRIVNILLDPIEKLRKGGLAL